MHHDPAPPIRLEPLLVAPETFVIRSAQPALGPPLSVGLHSMVIRGAEPVIVDTGTRANRDHWLADVFGLVEPDDVRWIVITHEDHDHVGNLAETLERCPRATLVVNWAMTERISCEIGLPVQRLRWLDPGQDLDVGDRTLRAFRPPVYDCPTTRALFDTATGVCWTSDAFATPMPADPVDRVEDLPTELWHEGLAMFHHHALCPWVSNVDRSAFATEVARLADLAPTVLVGAHTPVIDGEMVTAALDLLGALPDMVPPPHPDQAALEAALAGAGT